MLINGEPAQHIAGSICFRVPLVDLSRLQEDVRQAELTRLAGKTQQSTFDLGVPPLFRFLLIRLDETSHVLILTMHHAISDGWSYNVLIREMVTLYEWFSLGLPESVDDAPLPELRVQYADYALWQRKHFAGEVRDRALDFWKRQLAGAPALMSLYGDRPRPPVQTYSGKAHCFHIGDALTRKLKDLGKERKATLFMTLHAALAIMLSRYSGQQDICLGTPVANRDLEEAELMIGLFVNTIVLRLGLVPLRLLRSA